MGNNDILIPGMPADIEESAPVVTPEEYLKIINALSEIKSNGSQVTARQNLGVYGYEESKELGNQEESNFIVYQTKEIDEFLESLKHNLFDRLGSLNDKIDENQSLNQESYDQLTSQLETDFSTKKEHTALKQYLLNYITNTLKAYLTSTEIDERIVQSLIGYAESSQVYKKDEVYTKREIDKAYVKMDGTTPFTAPQAGVYPKFRKELATKGYADDCMKNHKNEADPHNFISKLNDKLNNYYKKSEVYTKAQTYDRAAIDSMIDKLVREACDSLIEEHINTTPHLTSYDILRVVKIYALENLLTKDEFRSENEALLEQVEAGLVWKPSGAVETSVGFVEDNTELPGAMTFQQIMDAIFYDREIGLTVPDNVNIGQTCEVTVCIHGAASVIEKAELYQNGELLRVFDPQEFEDGCVTVTSDPITEDTEFTLKVTYTNGTELEESKTVKCNMPIFIGSKPKWNQAYAINWEYLEDLEKEGYGTFTDINDPSYEFDFTDPKLRELFIVVPSSYPTLKSMETENGQKFGIGAFNIINAIPLQITVADKDIIYKIYVYKQALSSMHQIATFKFNE